MNTETALQQILDAWDSHGIVGAAIEQARAALRLADAPAAPEWHFENVQVEICQPPEPRDERVEFEKWAEHKLPLQKWAEHYPDRGDTYGNKETQTAWAAWQARSGGAV